MNHNNNSEPLKTTIQSYDKIAEDYCEKTLEGGDRGFQEKMLDITLNYLPEKPRVLDLGCGDGRDAHYLHQKGADVVGIDLSQGMINLARKKHPQVAFFKQDMRKTVFPDDTFDCVWASVSIINMPKSELSTIESEVFRILNPDGIFAFSIKLGEGEDFEENDMIPGYPRFFAYYSVDELKDRLKLFEIIDSKDYPGELFGSKFTYCWAKPNR